MKHSATSDETDIWKELFDDTHERTFEFRIVPSKEPGVHANLGGDSTAFDIFLVYLMRKYVQIGPNCFIRKPSAGVFQSIAETYLVVWDEIDHHFVLCSTPASRKRTKFRCNTCDLYLHPKEYFMRAFTTESI